MNESDIVILGGGYAGLQAALQFKRRGGECTLIDQNDYHELLPELPHCITAPKLKTQIPFGELIASKQIHFVKDSVELVDYKRKKIILASKRELHFEYLILALGSQTNYFNIPGLRENSAAFINTAQAKALIQSIKDTFAAAKNLKPKSPEYKEALSIVIGGGGLTGVEVAGELLHELAGWCKEYDLPLNDVKIIMIEAMPTLMPGGETELGQKVTDYFRAHPNVELVLSTAIKEAASGSVSLADGQTIRAKNILWTGGIRGSQFFDKSYIAEDGSEQAWPRGRGFRLEVDEFFRVKGLAKTFAVGDNALIIDLKTGNPVPLNGQLAYQQGKETADNIIADQHDRPMNAPVIDNKGILVSLGPKCGTGVVFKPFKWQMPVNSVSRKIKKAIEARYKLVDIRF